MSNWTFDAGAQSWGTALGFVWDAVNFCLKAEFDSGTGDDTSITGLSVAVNAGDPISARFRIVAPGTIGPTDPGDVGGNLDFDGRGQLNLSLTVDPDPPYDSGWQYVAGTISSGGTVTQISLSIASTGPEGQYYLDDVYLNEAPASTPQRRYLGLDADFGKLYLTSITGGSVTYYSIPQASLTADGTSTFGTAAYTDPDSFTKGLYPVVKPGVDGVVYLRGRDGNSKQTWYNDLNGTLGWVDIGPGTATWATTKFAVALMPDVNLPDDIIVAFSDNDVYRTEVGTAPWVKQGDATTNLRTAVRHPTMPDNLYLAGTAAGTAFHSVNMGVSYSSIGGTVVSGTINAIEVSR